jgi:hypothetical protein
MPPLYQKTVVVHLLVHDALDEGLPLYFQECSNETIRALNVNYEQLTTFLHYYCSMTEASFIQLIRCHIHVPVIIWRTLYLCWCAECCRLTWADSLCRARFLHWRSQQIRRCFVTDMHSACGDECKKLIFLFSTGTVQSIAVHGHLFLWHVDRRATELRNEYTTECCCILHKCVT